MTIAARAVAKKVPDESDSVGPFHMVVLNRTMVIQVQH